MSCEREVSVWSMEMSAPQESDPKKHFRKRDTIKHERVVRDRIWIWGFCAYVWKILTYYALVWKQRLSKKHKSSL